MGISLMSKEARERDLAIGIMLTFALGLGILFLSLYAGFAERVYAILFGDILGISQTDVIVTTIFSLLTIFILLASFAHSYSAHSIPKSLKHGASLYVPSASLFSSWWQLLSRCQYRL